MSSIVGTRPPFLDTEIDPRALRIPAPLESAVQHLKDGNRQAARVITATLLADRPNYIEAWMLAARLCDNRAQALYCVSRVLALDPGHAWALRQLERMGGAGPSAVPSSSTAPSSSAAQSAPPARPGVSLHVPVSWLLVGGAALLVIGTLIIVAALVLGPRLFSQRSAGPADQPALPQPTSTPESAAGRPGKLPGDQALSTTGHYYPGRMISGIPAPLARGGNPSAPLRAPRGWGVRAKEQAPGQRPEAADHLTPSDALPGVSLPSPLGEGGRQAAPAGG